MNAKAETVATSPAFREAPPVWKDRRALTQEFPLVECSFIIGIEIDQQKGQSWGFRLEIAEVIFAWPFLECHPHAEISFLELKGNGQSECRAATRVILSPEPPVVRFGDRAGQAKPIPSPLFFEVTKALKVSSVSPIPEPCSYRLENNEVLATGLQEGIGLAIDHGNLRAFTTELGGEVRSSAYSAFACL